MNDKNIPVVIMAGGKGLRIQEETIEKPKALVKINNNSIIYNIMKHYSNYGYENFIVLGGYMYDALSKQLSWEKDINWKVSTIYTGEETLTGGRLLKVKKVLRNEELFMLTYCDGVSDVNIDNLLQFHRKHGKIGTVTSIQPKERFGILDIDSENSVLKFNEKCTSNTWINGGFFVFNTKIFNYIAEDEMLENSPLINLSKNNELKAYKHDGFWKCCDNMKDLNELRKLYE